MLFDVLILNMVLLYGPNNYKTISTYSITIGGMLGTSGLDGGNQKMG